MRFRRSGKSRKIFRVFLVFLFFFSGLAFAEEKQWSAGGDGINWEDKSNWFSPSVPAAADDVTIDMKNADVAVSQNFFAKTLNIGGRETVEWTVNDFVYGIIEPNNNTDNALYIKKYGVAVLKGAGGITIKGSLKNSEEILPSEPAFMFGLE